MRITYFAIFVDTIYLCPALYENTCLVPRSSAPWASSWTSLHHASVDLPYTACFYLMLNSSFWSQCNTLQQLLISIHACSQSHEITHSPAVPLKFQQDLSRLKRKFRSLLTRGFQPYEVPSDNHPICMFSLICKVTPQAVTIDIGVQSITFVDNNSKLSL